MWLVDDVMFHKNVKKCKISNLINFWYKTVFSIVFFVSKLEIVANK